MIFNITLDLSPYSTKTVKKLFYDQILTRDEFIFELRERGCSQEYAQQVADLIQDKRLMNSATRMATRKDRAA